MMWQWRLNFLEMYFRITYDWKSALSISVLLYQSVQWFFVVLQFRGCQTLFPSQPVSTSLPWGLIMAPLMVLDRFSREFSRWFQRPFEMCTCKVKLYEIYFVIVILPTLWQLVGVNVFLFNSFVEDFAWTRIFDFNGLETTNAKLLAKRMLGVQSLHPLDSSPEKQLHIKKAMIVGLFHTFL